MHYIKINFLTFLPILSIFGTAFAEVTTYPAPAGAPITTLWSVTADSKNVSIYAGPSTQYPYSFCSFDFSGSAQMRITTTQTVTRCEIRPASAAISAVNTNGVVTFTITKPGQYTLLTGSDWRNGLHIFANPPETNIPLPTDANVIYYGPGVHDIGAIRPATGTTVYIHGSAFVKCGFQMSNVRNITVRGRGVLDGTKWDKWTGPTGYKYGFFHLVGTSNVAVDGVVIRGSWAGSAHVYSSSATVFNNVKVLNGRFMNEDGLTPINTKSWTIKNCFIRTDDDCIPIKGYNGDRGDCDSIRVEQCVLWCDRARPVLIGHETMVRNMKNITFRDCDVIHYNERVFHIEPCEDGIAGPNILFDNIRVLGEGGGGTFFSVQPLITSWASLQTPGFVDGVTFRNIQFTGTHRGTIADIRGYDATHTTKNVTFDHVMFNTVLLKQNSVGVTIGSNTSNIRFIDSGVTKAKQIQGRPAAGHTIRHPAHEAFTIAGQRMPVQAANKNVCASAVRVTGYQIANKRPIIIDTRHINNY